MSKSNSGGGAPAVHAPKFLTIAEVATRWSMSQRFVQQLAQTGEIASTRFGRRVHIPVRAVEVYEQAHTRQPGEHRLRSA